MRSTPDICYCIAARNEEKGIGPCLNSLARQTARMRCKTFVCLNGCYDRTIEVVRLAKSSHPQLNIEVLRSCAGLGYAYNRIVTEVSAQGFADVPLLFVDADVELAENVVETLLNELRRNDKVLIVGAWPVPCRPESQTFWEDLLYHVLHVRAFHPFSEVSVHDVRHYKEYARRLPQVGVPPATEERLRIYFHGRTYLLRDVSVYELPDDPNVGDDTYISNQVHSTYGPGVIRTRYDARVEYQPFRSLRTHFQAYKRYWVDLRAIDRKYPHFALPRRHEATRIDYKYVLQQPPGVIAAFLLYDLISHVERALFRLRPDSPFSEIVRDQKGEPGTTSVSGPMGETGMNMFAVLTQYCNLTCSHCYLPSVRHQKGAQDDFSEDSFRRSMENIASTVRSRIDALYLTGGEFLLLSYGAKAVDVARAAFPNSTIFVYTNGLPFKEDPSLFNVVHPDVFHVGIDAWHGHIDVDGRSDIVDLFLSNVDPSKVRLLVHWTRRPGDDPLFDAFYSRYGSLAGVEMEDRGLNTTTGRAAKFERPQYRKDEFWRPCSLGDHVLLKYDGKCYGCQFGIPWSILGEATSVDVNAQLKKLRTSPIGRVLRGVGAEAFYRHVCEHNDVEFTPYSCILCEELTYKGVDLVAEAGRWLGEEAHWSGSVLAGVGDHGSRFGKKGNTESKKP